MISPKLNSPWEKRGLILLLLALLYVVGTSLYFIQKEIVPFYPLYMDQNGYLSAAYAYSDVAKKEGVFSVVQAHLSHDSARLGFGPSLNSNMSLVASWLFLFFGENRLAALNIHLLSWILLLITIYGTIGKITRQTGYALAACSFFLFLKMPHVGAGGMEDFRMDFPAACWMGISIALWVLFLHQPRARIAWLATGAMAVLLFLRIIAFVYLALPLGFLALLILHSFWTGKRRGLRHALVPLLVFGLYAFSLIIWDWSFLRSYYFDTQLGTEVADRGADKTWANLPAALSYYPLSLGRDHFGWKPLYFMGIASIFSAALLFSKKKSSARKLLLPIRWTAILICFCAVIFPLVILTVNPHRTPQVAGISTAALALASWLIFLALSPRKNRLSLSLAASLLLLVGLFSWTQSLFASAPFKNEARLDALALNPVFAQIFNELTSDQGQPANFAVLDFQEALIGYGAWFYGREHLHSPLKVNCVFPLQVSKIDEGPLLDQLHQARIVILPRDPSILATRPYPISKSMLEHFPAVKADVSRRLKLQSSFTYQGVLYDIFVPQ